MPNRARLSRPKDDSLLNPQPGSATLCERPWTSRPLSATFGGPAFRDEVAPAMMAPEHERARLLEATIARAVEVLRSPITKIEVTGDKVRCWAGPRVLTMSYGHAEAVDSTGAAMPGSGHWWVAVDGDSVRGEADVATALGRVAGRWLRSWDSTRKGG